MFKRLSGFLLACLTAITAHAVQTETVLYRQGDAVLEGYVAWPDKANRNSPAVIIVHDWTGVGDYVKGRARQLAELGYVAFAADIYGKGVRPASGPDARAVSSQFGGNRPLYRARMQAALDWLQARPEVDRSRIAAMGYCFGGMGALELARSGAPIVGAITFHGSLSSPTPEDARNIKGKVLVLHGAQDPAVNADQVRGFQQEMNNAGVDYQFIAYSGAVHAFTLPTAGNDISKGSAYNANADRRSFAAMRTFLDEVFQ